MSRMQCSASLRTEEPPMCPTPINISSKNTYLDSQGPPAPNQDSKITCSPKTWDSDPTACTALCLLPSSGSMEPSTRSQARSAAAPSEPCFRPLGTAETCLCVDLNCLFKAVSLLRDSPSCTSTYPHKGPPVLPISPHLGVRVLRHLSKPVKPKFLALRIKGGRARRLRAQYTQAAGSSGIFHVRFFRLGAS